EHIVGFAVIHREIESCDFADAIRTARVKWSRFDLWLLPHASEHFTGSGKIEPALWLQLTQCREHIVRAIDVDAHCRKAIRKTLGHKALGGEVVALVEFVPTDHVKNTRVTLKTARMQLELV